jgi:hypothetical protein
MSDLSSNTKRNAFNEEIFRIVEEYLQEKALHPVGSVLAINAKSKSLKLGAKNEFPSSWDTYTLDNLIRKNEDDNSDEVDVDATFDIASKYYFVR